MAGPLPASPRLAHRAVMPPGSLERKVSMHVCLFDIDGTLIASGGAGKAALEAAMAEEFGIPHIIDKLQLSGRTDRAIICDLFRLHVIDDTPDNHARLREAYLRYLPHCLATHAGRVLPG